MARCPPTEPATSIPRTVAEVLTKHVTFQLEGIDRMYLNLYVPRLQCEKGLAHFWRFHRGHRFASSALMDPMTKDFVQRLERVALEHAIPVISFEKAQRKDDLAQRFFASSKVEEGVVFVGKAQEKVPVLRTERRPAPNGATYPWIVRSSAMVNQWYIHIRDPDFGPFFLKFGTYFLYTAKICLNGHEFLKCQLRKADIPLQALDNGIASCADPTAAQALADTLSAEKIDALACKWFARLPQPFTRKDRAAGFRYHISILQAEFSPTQVLDQPVHGRVLFEEVIRENLDIGRPDQVQLIFGRSVTRRNPGRFRTRVLTSGVIPSLHVDYKKSRIKQYHKEGQALRTKTTINDTRDFGVGKSLKNLPALRQIGFQANRRLLDVQKITQDCALGEVALRQVTEPVVLDDQRAAGLRCGQPRVLALMPAMVGFALQVCGFISRELRERLAPLLGHGADNVSSGRMNYDLRRFRLHGLIERIPKFPRYRLTQRGICTALFFTRSYARVLRSGAAQIYPDEWAGATPLRQAFDGVMPGIDDFIADAKLTR